MDEVDLAISEEIGKKKNNNNNDEGDSVNEDEWDSCVMRVNARALLRGHSGDIKVRAAEVVLGRGEGVDEVEGVIGVSRSKKVSRRACRIRHDEANE